jgi:hypothetical protein
MEAHYSIGDNSSRAPGSDVQGIRHQRTTICSGAPELSPLPILNNLADAILDATLCPVKVKTAVSYDDLRAGTERWGTIEKYKDQLVKTELSLSKCGKDMVFYTCPDLRCPGCGELVGLEYSCLNPYCDECSHKLRWRKTKRLIKVLELYKRPRKFELGWQGHHALTDPKIKEFKACINRIVRYLTGHHSVRVTTREGIAREIHCGSSIKKWLYKIEFVSNPDGFYFHVHCVYEGKYIPQEDLSDLWFKASKGSYITYIQEVQNRRQVLNDIAKYVNKPFKGISLARWVAVLKGNRLFSMSQNSKACEGDPVFDMVEQVMGGTYESPSSVLNRRHNSTSLKCRYCGKGLIPEFMFAAKDMKDTIPPPRSLKTIQNLDEYQQMAVDGISRSI